MSFPKCKKSRMAWSQIDPAMHFVYIRMPSRDQKHGGQLKKVQPTVTFPIGGHVNVLYDYKET